MIESQVGAQRLPPALLALVRDLDCHDVAERLNRECRCLSLDRERLREELSREAAGADVYRLIAAERPHLFSESTVFVGGAHLEAMARLIAAVERVVALPAYRAHVLAWAPPAAQYVPRASGVFLGYDFHLGAGPDGGAPVPQLIEINTNAGGALLNAVLARAQQACCEPVAALLPGAGGGSSAERLFVEMFEREWTLERGERPLRTIAIVDEDPPAQYLYPEFVLFARMFEQVGYRARIVDPAALCFDGRTLRHGDEAIDLVYNRLTDFDLDAPASAALREAHLASAVVLTPHPHAHALYADKRNLVALTDADLLARFGVDAQTIATLIAGIPRTVPVVREAADTFWAQRRQWFFKSAAGWGSKGAYRGDKLTRRVFEEIVAAGDYVAQALVPPSQRSVEVDAEPVELKLDLRNYVYRGEVQLVAARLYQGQTTNFRTPGGGFAPVITVRCEPA
jgi:hypothetical protein